MDLKKLKVTLSYQVLCNYQDFTVVAGFMDNKFLRVFTVNESTGEIY
jgi:hypothetical protein